MFNAFRISFSLKNTYRVNSILYAIKQLPLIKRLLPNSLYASRGLKTFANVLSAIWEVISTFLGKGIYLLAMVFGLGLLYQDVPQGDLFGHMLLFLTAIGAYMNTYMFNPTNDKYYAMEMCIRDSRKGYAQEVYDFIASQAPAGEYPVAADMGSGTGLFAQGLLERGYAVLGVEPLAQMREMAQDRLDSMVRYRAIPQSAEQTGLDSGSIDLITCLLYTSPEAGTGAGQAGQHLAGGIGLS